MNEKLLAYFTDLFGDLRGDELARLKAYLAEGRTLLCGDEAEFYRKGGRSEPAAACTVSLTEVRDVAGAPDTDDLSVPEAARTKFQRWLEASLARRTDEWACFDSYLDRLRRATPELLAEAARRAFAARGV